MNLDDFVKKAVSDVRNKRNTGKKGRVARKSLREGEEALAQTKKLIRETALACQNRTWKATRLIARRYIEECRCCHIATQDCTVIYLEQVHNKLGRMERRLDEIQVYSFPNLPRELEIYKNGDFICARCFTTYEHIDKKFEFKEPVPEVNKPLSKWEQEYKVFSDKWDKRERQKAWNAILPKFLLLEYKK